MVFAVLLLPVLCLTGPQISAGLEDGVGDLVHVWTGEKAEVGVGFVDVTRVEVQVWEGFLTVRVLLASSYWEAEGDPGLMVYLAFETDSEEENDCPSPPFAGTDAFYAITARGGKVSFQKACLLYTSPSPRDRG